MLETELGLTKARERLSECAVAGKAGYIVSGDNHLLSIGEYMGIIILSPAAFVTLLDTSIEA